MTQITAPIPGTIHSINVAVGQAVLPDTVLLILEAMKMENEVFAGVSGTVRSIAVTVGQTVNTDDLMVEIE